MTYKPTYRSPLVPIHLLYLLSINFSAIPAMPLCNTGGGLHIPGLRMLILWMPSTSHKIAPGNCGGVHMHVLDLFYYDRGQGGKGWIKSLLANQLILLPHPGGSPGQSWVSRRFIQKQREKFIREGQRHDETLSPAAGEVYFSIQGIVMWEIQQK